MRSIMYHYVRDYDRKYHYSKHKELETFKKECKYFKSKYTCKSVSEGLSDTEKSKTLLLTFDDGLKDHLLVAELLHKNNIKGTFYVPIYPYLKNDILSVHKAHIICSKIGGDCIELLKKAVNELGFNYDNLIDKNSNRNFEKKYSRHEDDSLIKEFKRIINYYGKLKIRDKVLNQILDYLSENIKPNEFYLTKNEIKHISNLGHEIGSHGITHTLLSRLNKTDQEKEIKFSKLFLESIINKEINSFCYPYGTKDSYNNTTIYLLKKYNYINAVSVEPRDISRDDLRNNIYELPRFDCNDSIIKK